MMKCTLAPSKAVQIALGALCGLAALPAPACAASTVREPLQLTVLSSGKEVRFRLANRSGRDLRIVSPFTQGFPVFCDVQVTRMAGGGVVSSIDADERGFVAIGADASTARTLDQVRASLEKVGPGEALDGRISDAFLYGLLAPHLAQPLREGRRYKLSFRMRLTAESGGGLQTVSVVSHSQCELQTGRGGPRINCR